MNKYLKFFLLILTSIVFLSSCSIENPTYIEEKNEIRVEFVTLEPNQWIPVNGTNYRWYQQVSLYPMVYSYDYTGIICYYLNEHNAWEALPSTRLHWLSDGTLYTDEIWYSNDDKYLYVDYRNTIPTNPSAPKDKLKLKIVYFYKT